MMVARTANSASTPLMRAAARWLLATALLAGCSADPRPARLEAARPAPSGPAAGPFTARVYANPDSSFGYEVRQNGQPLIRQSRIPGRSGARGFADSVQARRVAVLVVRKLVAGQLPPTVTAAELDSLGIPPAASQP